MRHVMFAMLVLCTACGSGSERAPEGSDSRLAAILPPAAAPDTSARARVTDPACDEMRTIAEHALTVQLVADTFPTFEAPRELGRWKGCRYTGQFTREAWSGVVPQAQLEAALKGSAWVSAPAWQADGPADVEFGYARGDHLCLYTLVTPAVDEPADSTPRDTTRRVIPYSIELRCTSPVPQLPH